MRKFIQWAEGLAFDAYHHLRLVFDRKYRNLHHVLKLSRWK